MVCFFFISENPVLSILPSLMQPCQKKVHVVSSEEGQIERLRREKGIVSPFSSKKLLFYSGSPWTCTNSFSLFMTQGKKGTGNFEKRGGKLHHVPLQPDLPVPTTSLSYPPSHLSPLLSVSYLCWKVSPVHGVAVTFLFVLW